MARASSTSKRRKPRAARDERAPVEPTERATGWSATSELRWRPGTGEHIIFVSAWSSDSGQDDQEQGEQGCEAGPRGEPEHAERRAADGAKQAEDFLPPVEMLKIVAERWTRLMDAAEGARPALISFRVPGVVSPAELTRWLPGAAARLYTLGGQVAPLADTALSKPPLARYSVVRAPNMSFWPQLRALIEEQEREEPGLELWDDLEGSLAQLEQELAWWHASPLGLILNLYEGETLVGHLSLARQYDEAEGCDGWGIIALHVARQARGQRLGSLLQRIASSLIVTHRATLQAPPTDDAAPEEAAQTAQMAAINTRLWPYIFGFVAAHNIPALRGAYRAGRRIIGTYVDVPLAALQSPGADQPADPPDG